MSQDIMLRYKNLKENYKIINENYIGIRSQLATAEDYVKRIETTLDELRVSEEQHLYAIEEFKRITTEKSNAGKDTLEEVLNWALSNITFKQEYSARIIEKARGTTGKELEIELTDKSNGYTRSVKDQTGTAMAQVISFLMLVITIRFSGRSRILVLDEVFSGLEEPETLEMFFSIMVALSKNEDFQFFMVEHDDKISDVAGITLYDLELDDYNVGTYLKKKKLITQDEDEIA